MTDAEIQRWRDDAFEAAAKICERYQVNSFVIGDIRALKSKLPAQENSLRPLNAQEQETVREFGEAVQREVIDPLVAKEKAQLYGNPEPSVEREGSGNEGGGVMDERMKQIATDAFDVAYNAQTRATIRDGLYAACEAVLAASAQGEAQKGCSKCGSFDLHFVPTNSQWNDDSIKCAACGYEVEHSVHPSEDMEFRRLNALAARPAPVRVEEQASFAQQREGIDGYTHTEIGEYGYNRKNTFVPYAQPAAPVASGESSVVEAMVRAFDEAKDQDYNASPNERRVCMTAALRVATDRLLAERDAQWEAAITDEVNRYHGDAAIHKYDLSNKIHARITALKAENAALKARAKEKEKDNAI